MGTIMLTTQQCGQEFMRRVCLLEANSWAQITCGYDFGQISPPLSVLDSLQYLLLLFRALRSTVIEEALKTSLSAIAAFRDEETEAKRH